MSTSKFPVEERPSTKGEGELPVGREDSIPGDETAPHRSDRRALAYILESVLFAAGEPLPLRRLAEVLDGATLRQIEEALRLLQEEYRPGVRGIHLVEVAGGYQFRTARENAAWVQALFNTKPSRLGRATLETLAIIAYKQPVTKAEIEAIRGVDVDGPLQTLLQRGLIRVAGRRETVGRPLLYATTPEFLETFGLKDLTELPALPEFNEVIHATEQTSSERPSLAPTTENAGAGRCIEPAPGGATEERAAPAENPKPSGAGLPPPSGDVDS